MNYRPIALMPLMPKIIEKPLTSSSSISPKFGPMPSKSRAFEQVWHVGLLSILSAYALSTKLCLWIILYRYFNKKLHREYHPSTTRNTRFGQFLHHWGVKIRMSIRMKHSSFTVHHSTGTNYHRPCEYYSLHQFKSSVRSTIGGISLSESVTGVSTCPLTVLITQCTISTCKRKYFVNDEGKISLAC